MFNKPLKENSVLEVLPARVGTVTTGTNISEYSPSGRTCVGWTGGRCVDMVSAQVPAVGCPGPPGPDLLLAAGHLPPRHRRSVQRGRYRGDRGA